MKKLLLWCAVSSLAICNTVAANGRASRFGGNVAPNPVPQPLSPGHPQSIGPNQAPQQQQVSGHPQNSVAGQSPEYLPRQAEADQLVGGSGPLNPQASLALASKSEGRLATNFLAEIGEILKNENVVINPFGIWSIVIMIFGVSGGKTGQELAQLLGTDVNPSAIESAYKAALSRVNINSEQVQSTTLNLVAKIGTTKLKKEFDDKLRSVFRAEQFSVYNANPQLSSKSAQAINAWASSATRGRITEIVQPGMEDFIGMRLMMGSAAFFKGKWKYPFNMTATAPDEFKDENDQIIGSVNMMRSKAILQYAFNPKLECQVLEIPYADGTTSMIVFLPRRRVSVQAVLNKMRGLSLPELLPSEMSEEEVDLSLPRFSTGIHAVLNTVFYKLGASSVLNLGAELPGLSDDDFVSKITHSAEIEVSEEGTTASAVTSAQVSYKTSSVGFHANRPFIYFINTVPSRVVVFAGKFSEPTAQSTSQ